MKIPKKLKAYADNRAIIISQELADYLGINRKCTAGGVRDANKKKVAPKKVEPKKEPKKAETKSMVDNKPVDNMESKPNNTQF